MMSGAIDAEFGADVLANGIQIQGTSVTLSGYLTSQQYGGFPFATGSGMTITGPITLAGDTTLVSQRSLKLGSVDGAHTLQVAARRAVGSGLARLDDIVFDGDIGSVTPLTALSIDEGRATFHGTVLKADQVTVGTGQVAYPVQFGAAGALRGNIEVKPNGVLSPGGVDFTGSLTVTGNVTFDPGSIYAPDLGSTSDHLQVNGSLTLTGAVLAGGYGMACFGAPAGVLDCGTLRTCERPRWRGPIAGTDAVQSQITGQGTGSFDPVPAGITNNLTGTMQMALRLRSALLGVGSSCLVRT